jgi:hypothetical protein
LVGSIDAHDPRQPRQTPRPRSPGSLVIPELGLATRRARVEIAHVTDDLAGFEIKGNRDDLDRLHV